MSEQEVSRLYNTLFRVESKIKPATYPIHKRLNFGANSELNDVYDWLFENLDLPNRGKILDAGCGVGYGSFYLCERTDCKSLGISLSEREVALANAVSKEKGLQNRVKFQVQSFDKPLPEKYDLIIAVESIKHTTNLKGTLQNLLNALSEKGKLVIIEDYFKSDSTDYFTKAMINDWHLKKAFTKADYLKEVDSIFFEVTVHDLTPFTLRRNVLKLKFRYYALYFISLIGSLIGKGIFWKIMKGGLALDILFERKKVTYEAIEIEKIN